MEQTELRYADFFTTLPQKQIKLNHLGHLRRIADVTQNSGFLSRIRLE